MLEPHRRAAVQVWIDGMKATKPIYDCLEVFEVAARLDRLFDWLALEVGDDQRSILPALFPVRLPANAPALFIGRSYANSKRTGNARGSFFTKDSGG